MFSSPGALEQKVVMTSKELLCSFMGIINVQCHLVYPKGSGDTQDLLTKGGGDEGRQSPGGHDKIALQGSGIDSAC